MMHAIGIAYSLAMTALASYLTGREIAKRIGLDVSTTPGAMPGVDQKGSR